MLHPWEIRAFYRNAGLQIPQFWKIGRKRFRIETLNHRFVKLNRFKGRMNPRALRGLCVKYAPVHTYFSVLDWLFPERVGKKYRANRALPVGGEYVIDVDAYVLHKAHPHHYAVSGICYDCLEIARDMTI
jgi:DNA primase catalytic subunit